MFSGCRAPPDRRLGSLNIGREKSAPVQLRASRAPFGATPRATVARGARRRAGAFAQGGAPGSRPASFDAPADHRHPGDSEPRPMIGAPNA